MGLRAIDGIPVDRARQRLTLMYRFRSDLQAGLEYNPLDDDVGVLLNWRALDETARRPAVIVGTSSDRIGTTEGRAYFATLSKNLHREIGLPISPYAGVAFGEQDDEFLGIGGVHITYDELWSSTHFWDGKNLHHLVSRQLPHGQALGILIAEQRDEHFLGLTYNVGFGGGSRTSDE